MTNLSSLIDSYAALKSELASLEKQKKALEAALADVPAGAYESENYRLTISDFPVTKDDDTLKALAKEAAAAFRFTLSTQYLTAHTFTKDERRHSIGLPTGKNLSVAA